MAYNGMTDATGSQIVQMFGHNSPKLGVLSFNKVHNWETLREIS